MAGPAAKLKTRSCDPVGADLAPSWIWVGEETHLTDAGLVFPARCKVFGLARWRRD